MTYFFITAMAILFIVELVVGISCYNGIFKSIINLKLRFVEKKYEITNKEDYLVTVGINSFFLALIFLIFTILSIFSSENTRYGLPLLTLILYFVVFASNKAEKKYLLKKG